MSKVHHYMVDFEDAAGSVQFANDAYLFDLAAAKKLAAKTSKTTPHQSAYVVAFADKHDGTFDALGHVGYFDGRVSDTAGVFAA